MPFVMLALLVVDVFINLCHGKTGIAGLLWHGGREQTWAITLALFAAMLAADGFGAKGRWDGIFIDARNRISLGRFQLILWTVLLVSALFTAGLTNTIAPLNPSGALAIYIPPQIWALLGLGAFSAVTAQALLARRQRADKSVITNALPAEASWMDLTMSDTEPHTVDITKVQQLAFTALLIAVYASDLWVTLSGDAAVAAFPAIDTGFLALLTISHVAYLSGKTLRRF